MERETKMVIYACILIGLSIIFINIKQTSAKKITLEPKFKRMLVTAYCPCEKCCGQYAAYGKTSKGRDAWKTFGVAADPKVLPYGKKLRIPGIGIREVDDTGGAMRQSTKKGICHIDTRFHNHQEALNFGRQWLNVEILN